MNIEHIGYSSGSSSSSESSPGKLILGGVVWIAGCALSICIKIRQCQNKARRRQRLEEQVNQVTIILFKDFAMQQRPATNVSTIKPITKT